MAKRTKKKERLTLPEALRRLKGLNNVKKKKR